MCKINLAEYGIIAWATTYEPNQFLVLRNWGKDKYVTHVYFLDTDSFEYGRYYESIKEAAKSLKNRIHEYRELLDLCPF